MRTGTFVRALLHKMPVPMCSVMNSKEHRNEMSRTFYRSGN